MADQTIEQRRAAHAWKKLESKKLLEKKEVNELKKLPNQIMNSGLGQTIAFIRAKTDQTTANDAIKALSEWINIRIPDAAKSDLLERIKDSDALFLRRATDEAMAYLQWYIRFAEAHEKSQ